MKYYLCINEIEEKKENSDVNWFIQYTFSTSNSSGYCNCYNEKQYGFRKNYIYHTTSYSDDYIVDDNGKSHKVLSVVPKYFVPFEFVVDERIKKIQEKKKEDKITIIPYSIEGHKVWYNIICETKVACSQTFDTSQYDGVIWCYKRIRAMSPMYGLWRDILRYNKHPNKRLKEYNSFLEEK